ncbi:MAG TPA: cation:proton antiporter [Oligoflexus sp.]|uniref:cation:proton antiporter n=1 Tax=Oligoflexus sp. TaxID=1971216 RepID=UPI002D3DA1C1|nr:cation:proton antiporter [Oligoflexus sp.]HYX33429.1 cation:proton antiporter [Oligoflexus sp.]
MDNHSLVTDVALSILGAAALGLPAYLLRLPLVLAYLAAGLILGPSLGLGLVRDPQSIATLSEIGLVLLMFILGLEIDLRKLMRAGRAVLINGVTQFAGCTGLALGMFYLLGYQNRGNDYTLTYLAIAGSLSSTLVVVKVLSDRLELDLMTSRITLGILVLQDLWAISFLALQPNLDQLAADTIFLSLAKAVFLISASWLAARYVLPHVFQRIGKQPELVLVAAMGWCFGISGLAGWMQLSREMGALVAGISIAAFPYHTDIAAKITSLRDFFITLFFVALGMQIPSPSMGVITLAGWLTFFVIFSRLLTVSPVLFILGYGSRGSLVPAINLGQMSEFSLVLATLGVSLGHVPRDFLSACILTLVASFLISSVLMPKVHVIHNFLSPWFEKLRIREPEPVKEQTDEAERKVPRIVLLGFYREASSFLEELTRRHTQTFLQDVLVVDYNPETLAKLHERNVQAVYGDVAHSETLRHLHLDKAAIIISTVPDHLFKGTSNLKLLRTLQDLAPQAMHIVTAETIDAARQMYAQGASYVFIPRIVAAHYLVDVIERIQSNRLDAIKQGAEKFISKWQETLP